MQYEHGSILKFVEDQFGLGTARRQRRPRELARQDCFDFHQPPRAFVPFKAALGREFFLYQPADHRPPDDQ